MNAKQDAWNWFYRELRDGTPPYSVPCLAHALEVSESALDTLGTAWHGEQGAFAFPMRLPSEELVGLRLRDFAGKKWAVTGSRSALFIPQIEMEMHTLAVVEGPTDCAAALDLGLSCIGRAACRGQEEMVVEFVRSNEVRNVILIADNDGPGKAGAVVLQAMLPVPSVIWLPPCKDLREFVTLGGDRQTLDALAKDLVWTQPKNVDCPIPKA